MMRSTEPSREARQLLVRLAAQQILPIDVATLRERRRRVQIAYEPRIRRALARFRPTVVDCDIAGVRCLDITVGPQAPSGTLL